MAIKSVQLHPNNPSIKVQQGGVSKVHIDRTFNEILEQAKTIRFSNHAQSRLQKREINITEEDLKRLSNAIDQVERKGGRESLILMDGIAFIVNVPERLIVTAVDADSRRGGIFTQIDSVVLAETHPSLDRSA